MENENANVKQKSKGLIIGLAAAAVVIIAAIVLFIFQPWAANVGAVDSLKITPYEYTFFTKFNMNQFLSSLGNGTTTPDKYDWNTKTGTETAKTTVKKSTLDQIQELKIQIIKAKEAGLKLEDSDKKSVDDAINQHITQYGGTRNVAEEGIKRDYGVTLSELKAIYTDLTLAQKYRELESKKVNISDDDVKKYYDENKKNFDKVTVTHILVKTVDESGAAVSAGKKSEAKKKAEELLARVKAGEDIKKLAEENSDDKPAATTKGGRGYQGEYTFGRGEMVPEFEEWAFKDDRKSGDSDIVETSYGYHVMQFQKRAETPLNDIKDNLKNSLLGQKQSEEFNKKIDEFKKDTKYAVNTNESAIAKLDKNFYGA